MGFCKLGDVVHPGQAGCQHVRNAKFCGDEDELSLSETVTEVGQNVGCAMPAFPFFGCYGLLKVSTKLVQFSQSKDCLTLRLQRFASARMIIGYLVPSGGLYPWVYVPSSPRPEPGD